MKTKIVYVISSNEKDLYLDQTLLSVFSLRKYNSDAEVILVVDALTNLSIKGDREAILKYVTSRVVVDVPKEYNQIQTSRYIKTNLRKYVQGDFLFVDSDTIITGSLDEIDNFNGDIGMVLNVHVPLELQSDKLSIKKRIRMSGWHKEDYPPYYNSGVIFVKDNEIGHRFYEKWHEIWEETLKKYHFHYDQPSLSVANVATGFPVQELSGIWNCQIMNNGLPFLYNAKIIHYFAYHAVSKRNADKAYLFHDKRIYQEIKEKGDVPDSISELIDNAKSSFNLPCKIVVGNELNLLSNNLYKLAMNHTRIYNFFERMAYVVRLFPRAVKKFKKEIM